MEITMQLIDPITRQYSKPKGSLVIIGGHEDKERDCVILKEVARRATRGKGSKEAKESAQGHQIVIAAVASTMPEEVIPEYKRLFRALGVEDIGVLEIRRPDDAHNQENAQMIRHAAVVFFTGGDQLRITSQIGVTPVFEALYEMYLKGGTIVGTSAGAAAMRETMVISGESSGSKEIRKLDMD